MSMSIRDYGVIGYLLVYQAMLLLPRFLYRKEQMFGRPEISRGFPRHQGALNLLPRLTSGLTVVLLMVVFAMWLNPAYMRTTTTHAIGIGYGILLVLDASFAWITGIRPIIGLRQRYVVTQGSTLWPMLQFTLSLLFLAIPIGFLLNT